MTSGAERVIVRTYAPCPTGWRLTLQTTPAILDLAPSAVRVHLHHVGPTIMAGTMGEVTDVVSHGELLHVTVPQAPFAGLLYILGRYRRELHREWSAHRPTPDNDFRITLESL